MPIMDKFLDQSSELNNTIVLAEGYDERMIEAAATILKHKIAKLIILGDEKDVLPLLKSHNVKGDNFQVIEPAKSPLYKDFVDKYYEMRKSKGMGKDEAEQSMKNTLYFGAMLVHADKAEGCVAGAANTTGDVLRAAIRVIGTKEGIKTVSSCFIMATGVKEFGANGAVLFGDCAVNPDPDPEMLADIAISTAASCEAFFKTEPKVALLSFSTKGSADTESTQKVLKALEIAKAKKPDLMIDGELQVDAALLSVVASRKAPGSKVAGQANVLIFPNLDAGNIGYKLVERFGRAEAIGPIIQGLAKPMNDLSRGCNANDIVNITAITSVLGKRK